MTLKSNKYPWCVMDANKDPNGKQLLLCTRCKKTHELNAIGMSVDTFLRLSEAFCMLHSECKEEQP